MFHLLRAEVLRFSKIAVTTFLALISSEFFFLKHDHRFEEPLPLLFFCVTLARYNRRPLLPEKPRFQAFGQRFCSIASGRPLVHLLKSFANFVWYRVLIDCFVLCGRRLPRRNAIRLAPFPAPTPQHGPSTLQKTLILSSIVRRGEWLG